MLPETIRRVHAVPAHEAPMSKALPRKYSSRLREEQAQQTRQRILDATEKLLLERGYAKTTIEAVAAEAGVSAQTIYVIFRNKWGIMGEVITRVFEDDAAAMRQSTCAVEDPREALRIMVTFLVNVREATGSRFALFQMADLLSPELAQIQKSCLEMEQQRQAEHVRGMLRNARLKTGMTLDRVVDIFWYLTNVSSYQTLVTERGWSHQDYADWLYASLVAVLE